jgi:hypothetical protein
MGSLEDILKQAQVQANALLESLANLANMTRSVDNEPAAAAESAQSRPGTDEEGRCKAFRDDRGSAYFTFTVDKFANRSVSTNQSVQAGENDPNLGRRLREQKGVQEGDTKKEGAGTERTTKRVSLAMYIR